jgi:predicted nucleic acid-binding protein
MKVCLDTHILIWGIKKEATEGQEEMVHKTKLFFRWLDQNGMKAIIPSIVIGEFLMLIPPEMHDQINNFFHKNFIVVPYDTASASCFAKIWQSKISNGTIEKIKNNSSATRAKLKADCQIVATAIVHGASCIYSYDEDLAKFAKGYIEVKQIPDIPEQLTLINETAKD